MLFTCIVCVYSNFFFLPFFRFIFLNRMVFLC